jgi:Tol biopolymer transport system component
MVRLITRRDWLRAGLAGLVSSSTITLRADEPKRKGRIYFVADSLLAIDPETGDSTAIFTGCESRLRISPDGKLVAYRFENALWVREIDGDAAEPRKVTDLDDKSAAVPVWMPDGERLIISPGHTNEATNHWEFKTIRVKLDGSDREELPLPDEDGVFDVTSDGATLLTASSRNAEIGWQLYLMKADGTEVRQLTEGGNPFYCRLSPDGKHVVYTDGTSDERRGIWISALEGKKRERVLATGKADSSACFSPDSKRIAVIVSDRDANGAMQGPARLEIMDLDGGNNNQFPLTEGSRPDMPDWR